MDTGDISSLPIPYPWQEKEGCSDTLPHHNQQLLRQQLIRQYIKTGKLVCKQQPKRGFARCYSDADIVFLAELDEINDPPCGAVIKNYAREFIDKPDMLNMNG